MGVDYKTSSISQLDFGVAPHPLMTEIVTRPIPLTGGFTMQEYASPDSTWYQNTRYGRFQIHSWLIPQSHHSRYPEEWDLAYWEMLLEFIRVVRPRLVAGHWLETRLCHILHNPCYDGLEKLPASEQELYRRFHLTAEKRATLSAEELAFVEWCYEMPFERLSRNELPDLEGWLIYLGPELVEAYGWERLVGGPFHQVHEAPHEGLILETYPCPWVHDNPNVDYFAVQPAQLEYLGVDSSWFPKLREIDLKAAGRK